MVPVAGTTNLATSTNTGVRDVAYATNTSVYGVNNTPTYNANNTSTIGVNRMSSGYNKVYSIDADNPISANAAMNQQIERPSSYINNQPVRDTTTPYYTNPTNPSQKYVLSRDIKNQAT